MPHVYAPIPFRCTRRIAGIVAFVKPALPQHVPIGHGVGLRDEHFGCTGRTVHIQVVSGRGSPYAYLGTGWTGVQFAKGAAISIVWDSILNGIKLISKKGNKITIPEMAKNAGTFGLLWIAVGLVVDGFDKLYRNKQS